MQPNQYCVRCSEKMRMIETMNKLNKSDFFGFGIHILHINWLVILWKSLNEQAELTTSPILFISWTVAFLAEIIRWDIVGRESMIINGSYSYGRAIEIAMDRFFSLSWYLGPPTPPSKFLHETAEALFHKETDMQLRQVFSNYFLTRFYLGAGGIAIYLFFFAVSVGTPPTLGGIVRSYYISLFYWYICFTFAGRMIFILSYSFYVRLQGVK